VTDLTPPRSGGGRGHGGHGRHEGHDTWKIYLATDDMAKTVETAQAKGAEVIGPSMAVADLGTQAVLVDPCGAHLGVWQPDTFQGFTVLGEPGIPSWFELSTRDHAGAVNFYRSVFDWDTNAVGDSDDFRYTTVRDPSSGEDLAGIMDAAALLPGGIPSHWLVYWMVEDAEGAVAKVESLGGSVVMGVEESPYGRLATVADPAGAQFKLHTPNR